MRFALNAREVQTLLNGFLCVYKPRDISFDALRRRLVASICKAGQELDDSEVPTMSMPVVESHPASQAPVVVGMRTQLDYRYFRFIFPSI